MPDGYRARENKSCQDEGLDHRQDLCGHQQAMTVPAIDQHPGKRGKYKRWNPAGEADDPQEETGLGQTENEPADGDLLHPGADQRDALAAEKETVIPVGEGPEDEPEALQFVEGRWV